MADEGAVLPGALGAEGFFGRVGELRRLRSDLRWLSRGRGRSRALCARAGSGKTELLVQWHGRLFREGEVLPVYFAVPGRTDARRLAVDFVSQLGLHALAFKARDPALFLRSPAPQELAGALRAAYGAGGALLADALAQLQGGARGDAPLAWAAQVPQRFAAAAGLRLACLLDDAGRLLDADPPLAWPAAAAASALAPLLIAVEDESVMTGLFGHEAAAVATLERLGPLQGEAVQQLARHLARTAGLELGESSVAALERESAGSPYYLSALLRALGERPGTSPEDVACAAAAAVCDGELARYWVDRLGVFLPVRAVRATALEILAYLIREDRDAPDPQRLAGLMLKSEVEIEEALSGLCRAGVVRADCARIVVDDDPIFRSAVLAMYQREFGKATPTSVTAGCAAEKVRGAPAEVRRRERARFRDALAALLLGWRGQQVPGVLFDAAEFRRLREADAPPADAPASDGGFTVTLPQVISVTSGRVGLGAALPGIEVDALAWAVRGGGGPDADVAWVACRLAGGAGGAEQAAGFDRNVAALQAAGDLPATRLVRWAILDAPFDQDGERAAAQLRLKTSTRPQLAALAQIIGVAPPPAEPREQEAAPTLEMEMTIPRAVDAELVAARALEQLAENLEMDPEEAGRLKTALVEACINAFEHSGDKEGRVRLWFAVSGRRLLLRIENRGRSLDALPADARGGELPRRRGWGLTLIRQLVDEVTLEPREDGVSLLMVKNLGARSRG